MCEQAEDRKQMDVVAGGAGRLERMGVIEGARMSECIWDQAPEAAPATEHWRQTLGPRTGGSP